MVWWSGLCNHKIRRCIAISVLNGTLKRLTSHIKWKWYAWISAGGGNFSWYFANSDFMPRMLDSNVKLWESVLDKQPMGLMGEVLDSDMQKIRIWCPCLEKIHECISFKVRGEVLGYLIILLSRYIFRTNACRCCQCSWKLHDHLTLPGEGENEASWGLQARLSSGPAHVTASSAFLTGPTCGLHFCKAHGDQFREAAAGKLEEHNIWVWRKVFQSLLLPNYMMLGDSTSCSSIYLLVRQYYPPQRCCQGWDSDIREHLYSSTTKCWLPWLAAFWRIIYLISFYLWSLTYAFCFALFYYIYCTKICTHNFYHYNYF